MSPNPDGRKRILVSDKLSDEGIEILKNGGKFEVVVQPDISMEELGKVLGEFDGLAIRSRTHVTGEMLNNSGRLKVIGRAGVGLDNVDINTATEHGIIVMNTPEGNTLSTAEHSVSMILSLVRRIPHADRTMKEGKWAKKSITGVELYGKTLGVLGLGKIGREVAKRMKAFGMRILAFDPFVTPAAAEKLGIEMASVDEICERADIITVHTPLTSETKGIINAARMKKMKPGVLLVNCARGGIIDENDLVEALQNGKVAGAALDVFTEEPLPADHPLRTLDNVVLTPHLAASTTEAQEKVTRDVAQQIVEVLEGGMIRNAVNVPSIDPQELERLAPVLELCERLGKFASQYCPAPVERIEVLYSGGIAEVPPAPMTTAVIKGYLKPQVTSNVNEVNAHHLASSRGIEVVESRSEDRSEFVSLITLYVKSANGEENSISGRLFYNRDPRLVLINEKHCEIRLQGNMIVIQNRDIPGIVGSVGTLLGERKINIAHMNWGRVAPGHDAITVLNVDDEIPNEVIEELRSLPNIISVQRIVI